MKYFTFFKNKTDLGLLTLGNILSSIGVSFTMIVTYSLLESRNASPSLYSLSFILETAPGAFAAWVADKYYKRLNIAKALIVADFTAGILLFLPILGVYFDSLALLLAAGVIGSANVGFSVPYQRTHTRRVLQDDEETVATLISTYSFAITFIIGTIGGTFLLQKLGPLLFYFIDGASYFLSCGFTLLALKLKPQNFAPQAEPPKPVTWEALYRAMDTNQKKALFLNTLLVINCAPCAALLPSLNSLHSTQWQTWGLFLSLAMTFIILKTLGQIIGPLLVEKHDLGHLIKKNWIVPVSLLSFQVLYCAIFYIQNLGFILPLVVVAHMASNIIYILGYYSLLRYFTEKEIGAYSSFLHQISILALIVSCVWSGWVADNFGIGTVGIISLSIGAFTSFSYLKLNYKKNEATYAIA